MIRVGRPAVEPPALARQRNRQLPKALKAYRSHGAPSEALNLSLKSYDAGREVLYRAQHKKCAFCDQRQALKGNAVEHFRPKAGAARRLPGDAPVPDEVGYWWLTWTWRNQLFACASCNSGYKRTYFPLRTGTTALAGPAAGYTQKQLLPAHENTSVEDCLLLDPTVDSPHEYLDWRPVEQRLPKRLWQWTVVPRKCPTSMTFRDKARAEATIAILGLDRLAADHLTPHLQDYVLWRAEEVCARIQTDDVVVAQRQWQSLLADVTHPGAVMAGATWSALHYLVEEPLRLRVGLAFSPAP